MTTATEPVEDPIEARWSEARFWVSRALTAFGSLTDVATLGLTRSADRRLSAWLFAIEGAVRRLILIAAIALKLEPVASALRSGRTSTRPAPAGDPEGWRASFPIFRVHPILRGPRVPPRILTLETIHLLPVKKHRPAHVHTGPTHAAFASDPLLGIYALESRAAYARTRPPKEPAPRKPTAYPTRFSRSRRISEEEAMHNYYFRESPAQLRDAIATGLIPAPPERPARNWTSLDTHPDDGAPANRIEPLIPARALAMRLEALRRIMLAPEKCVRRTARLLARYATRGHSLPDRFQELPAPEPRRPHSDHLAHAAQMCLDMAHTDFTRRSDTS